MQMFAETFTNVIASANNLFTMRLLNYGRLFISNATLINGVINLTHT